MSATSRPEDHSKASAVEKSKYWICDECAKKKGGIPPDWAVTVTKGNCAYCNAKDVILTPTCDYRWQDGRKPIWD